MTRNRREQLKKNFSRMFWIKAFLNLRLINIVLSIFYIHRGLTLSQIFYLGVIWAAAGLLFEVPSSYLADKWGRKKTIILWTALMCVHWIIYIFASGFLWLGIGVAIYGIAHACGTGTDEALVYDTERELGREKNSLQKLGQYKSARNIFKIFTPIIAVFIAKDLSIFQFQILLGIDFLGGLIALILTMRIVEPHHKMDVEKVEAGVMKDAWKIIKTKKNVVRAILNQETLFFAVFIPWVIFQKFFVDIGLTIVFIGIGWGIRHFIIFLWSWYAHRILGKNSLYKFINRLADVFTGASLILLLFIFFFPNAVVLYIMYLVVHALASFRGPFFSEFFHKRFRSYNRATTISLSNLLHNVIEIPLALLSGLLVALDPRNVFVIAFVLGLIVVIFLRIEPSENRIKKI